jgi:hypothetical protein
MTPSKRKLLNDIALEAAIQKKTIRNLDNSYFAGVVQIALIYDFDTQGLYKAFVKKAVANMFCKKKRK